MDQKCFSNAPKQGSTLQTASRCAGKISERANLSDADVVFVYLLRGEWKSWQQTETRVKPGSVIVSNSFIFPSLKRLEEDRDSHVYSFTV